MNRKALTLVCATLLSCSYAHGNLIVNGDFEAGATGFLTDYAQDANVSAVRTYTVSDTVPNGWAPGFGDHTSGSGLMAIYNASTDATDVAWQQSVDLVAGALYEFSFWATALTESIRPGTSPIIRVSFGTNFKALTRTFRDIAVDDFWQQRAFRFAAPTTGSFDLSLLDTRGVASGDDFALDDLSLVRTDVVVAVPEPSLLYLLVLGIILLSFMHRTHNRANPGRE